MDTFAAHALIDSYSVKDCAVILSAYAPDLCEQLHTSAKGGLTGDALLSLARTLAKQAYDREKKPK